MALNSSQNFRVILSLFGISLLFLLVTSFSSLDSLLSAWETDEYSHGYLIPFVAFFIGWHRLTEHKPVAKSNLWGVGVILAGGLLMLVGMLSAFQAPVHYGLLLSITGAIFAYWGRAVTVVLLPALIYLVFAIPLPRLIYVNLSQELQLISSSLGVMPLQLLGISVFQDGNVIDLGNMRLQVVEACSGLRYLFPLMSFGFLIALMLKDRFWKRAFLFLSTIPITIGMNAMRISVIGITVNYWGQEMAEGLLHDMEGFTIFFACLSILLIEVWLLLKIGKHGTFRFDYFDIPRGAIYRDLKLGYKPAILTLVLSVLLALSSGAIDKRAETIPEHVPLAHFPTTLNDWKGSNAALSIDALKELKLTDYWMADYVTPETKAPVNLYIAYYESQRAGASVHSPANCIPGNGWVIDTVSTKTISVDDVLFSLKRVLIRKGEMQTLVYYWFAQRGRTLHSQYGVKWYLLWDSIFMNRTDGALIRLTTPISRAESERDGDKRLGKFLKEIQPLISKYIPVKH